jgi:hypothetical protein
VSVSWAELLDLLDELLDKRRLHARLGGDLRTIARRPPND